MDDTKTAAALAAFLSNGGKVKKVRPATQEVIDASWKKVVRANRKDDGDKILIRYNLECLIEECDSAS